MHRFGFHIHRHITGGDNTWCDGIMGVMRVVILARSSSDFEAIRAECERRRLAYNAGWVIILFSTVGSRMTN